MILKSFSVHQNTHSFAEALEMHNLALTQKFYCVVYVRVVGEGQDVVIHCSCLLLCYYHVFAMFALSVALRRHLSQRARLLYVQLNYPIRLSLWESCQR